jgi:type 1 glutamine amidotransferase
MVLAAIALFTVTPSIRAAAPVKVLIITGDHIASAHDWRGTTNAFRDFLQGHFDVSVTTTPARDLTPENLDKFDVLLLNYRDTPTGEPETRWSDANKRAFLDAVRNGKGLVVHHNAGAAFNKPNWSEFERAIGGGWRSQGNHGPRHRFVVKKTDVKHPISEGLPAQFTHHLDELYQNSLMVPGNLILATAYSDPSRPRGTGKDEPVVWINHHGTGRVFHIVLGHDTTAMADPNFQKWLIRGIEWAGKRIPQ